MKAGFAILIVGVFSTLCLADQVWTRTVSGWVIDYQARPVEGATVVCYGLEPGLDQRNIWDRWQAKINDPLARTNTGSDGRFSFTVAATEGFSPRVVAGKKGLALGWCHYTHSSELTPTIRLGKPSLFKGVVVDEAGRPLPGARVRICLKNRMMAEYTDVAPLDPENWFITHTNMDGQFVFNNIPKGATADFEVKAAGRATIWTFCDSGLDAGEQFLAGRTDIRIVLPLEARLSGVVVEESTGRALAGICILARPYSSAGWHDHHCPEPVQTDESGQFELDGLAPGKYQLEATSDHAGSTCLTVTLKAGQTMRDVKIPLHKGIPFEVAVYDAEEGKPIEDVDVTITQKPAESRYNTFTRTVTTDANGLVRLNVPPEECEVKIHKSGYGAIFEPQRVQLDPEKVTRHEISLPRTACILSGEVLDEKGRTLSNAQVMRTVFGPRAPTDINGHFDTSHMGFYMSRLPSKIQILARHISSGLGGIGTLEDPDKSGRPKGRITLKPAYTLTGRVTDPDGRSIPAAYVRLLLGRYRLLVTEVHTDADGAYSIYSIPMLEDSVRDSYIITVTAEGFGITQVIQIPFHGDTTKPVQLDPIVLKPANQIVSGVVEDANDQPVAGVLVEVFGPRLSTNFGQPPCGKTLTDAQGRFRVEGMCKESLQIRATSPPPQDLTGYTWAYGGNENVRIVLGQKLVFGESLIGKPLPELKNMKIELPQADLKGKVVLLCFFDMNQRPSRNCLQRLSKRAQELKTKNIVLIAIQSSKIDENVLNKWIEEQNISFPAGVIEGDEQEIRFTWGVKSLPWLILTDKQHVVQTEGFILSDLDENLKENK